MSIKSDILAHFLVLLIFNFGSIRDGHSHNILVPYAWRTVDFIYPSEAERSEAIANGNFVPANVLVNDVDAWPGVMKSDNAAEQRVFVTTPRVANGIPATLSTVSNIRSNDSFLLSPFPSWASQTVDQECNGIIAADKILIDKCGLLWIVDTGVINGFFAPRRVCTPKILIYDLKNQDTLIERYEFPTGVFLDRSGFTTTATDSRSDNCRDSIAYIADLSANGLVVFDLYQRTSWRVESNHFYPYPRFGTFTIAGQSFDLMDGIFGTALGPILPSGDRILYFHCLASIRESWVLTSDLRNRTLVQNPDAIRQRFFLSPEFREGQSSLEVMTENGILVYADVIHNSLRCWNTATQPIKENTQLVYESFEHLQFVSGLKLKGDTLWIATNRVQTVLSRTNTSTNIANDFRMRVIVIKSITELLKGTKCSNPIQPSFAVTPPNRISGLPPPPPPPPHYFNRPEFI